MGRAVYPHLGNDFSTLTRHDTMKRKILSTLAALLVTGNLYADNHPDPGWVLVDILLYRPAGLVATVAGAGVFVAMAPLTALAQTVPPHDAFDKTAEILIGIPGHFTFVRPLGARTLTAER